MGVGWEASRISVSTTSDITATLRRAAKKLARALGVSVDYLIGTFEDDEPGDSEPADVALGGA